MIKLTVLPTGGAPAYKQIADQLASQILSGMLMGGSPLPPIRTVAKELGVSIITVRSAWDELEAEGLIEPRAGSGCFVSELTEEESAQKRRARLKAPARELIQAAASLGFTPEETAELILREYREQR